MENPGNPGFVRFHKEGEGLIKRTGANLNLVSETDIVRGSLDYMKLRGLMTWRQNAGVIPLPTVEIQFW